MPARKAKLLIVGPTPPPYYGVATATERILNSTLRTDFIIIHLDTSDRRPNLNFNSFDLTNVCLALKHIFQLVWKTLRHHPRIVYIPISQGTWGYLRDAVFVLISKMAGAKVVLHLRGGYFRTFYEESGLLIRLMIKLTLTLSSRILVLGHGLLRIFEGLADSWKLRVVPNGLDSSPFPMAHSNGRNGSVRVCFISNLDETKGFGEALKAVQRLHLEYDIEYVIAGAWKDSKDAIRYQEYLKQHNLEKVVQFVGAVHGEQKDALLSSSDIFVLPTYFPYEGQPWAILEAMAAGLPVIATDHGCIAETLVEGETGFIVPKYDVESLSKRLKELIVNPALRVAMGRKGRTRVETVYSNESFTQRLRSVFNELA